MNRRNTNFVAMGKACYISLCVNVDKITLEPTDERIPANIITSFGPSFYVRHNEWFRNEKSLQVKTKIDVLEQKTKLEGLIHFTEKLEKKGNDRGADYILFLEEFKIGQAVSSWVMKGNFQLLVKICSHLK